MSQPNRHVGLLRLGTQLVERMHAALTEPAANVAGHVDAIVDLVRGVLALAGTFQLQAVGSHAYLNGVSLQLAELERLRAMTAVFKASDVGGFSLADAPEREEIADFVAMVREGAARAGPLDDEPHDPRADRASIKVARTEQPRFFAIVDAAVRIAAIAAPDTITVAADTATLAYEHDGQIRVSIAMRDVHVHTPSSLARKIATFMRPKSQATTLLDDDEMTADVFGEQHWTFVTRDLATPRSIGAQPRNAFALLRAVLEADITLIGEKVSEVLRSVAIQRAAARRLSVRDLPAGTVELAGVAALRALPSGVPALSLLDGDVAEIEIALTELLAPSAERGRLRFVDDPWLAEALADGLERRARGYAARVGVARAHDVPLLELVPLLADVPDPDAENRSEDDDFSPHTVALANALDAAVHRQLLPGEFSVGGLRTVVVAGLHRVTRGAADGFARGALRWGRPPSLVDA